MSAQTPSTLSKFEASFTTTAFAALHPLDPAAAYGPRYFFTADERAEYVAGNGADTAAWNLDRESGEWLAVSA